MRAAFRVVAIAILLALAASRAGAQDRPNVIVIYADDLGYGDVSAYGIALIHDALGEKEPALAALQRSYEDRAVEFALGHYPSFKAIAAEPGFQAVMRRVGLPR